MPVTLELTAAFNVVIPLLNDEFLVKCFLNGESPVSISRSEPKCDCGGEKAKTLHAHWCSLNSLSLE